MVRKVRTLFAAGCCAALIWGWSGVARADGCAKDTDCKGARICVKNACVDAPPVRSCGRDLDCPGDDICEQHICIAPAKVKSGKGGKLRKRDLIKEAAREAAEEAAKAQPPAPSASAPAPADSSSASAASSVPPPLPPPSLVKGESKAEPAKSDSAPEAAQNRSEAAKSEPAPAGGGISKPEAKAPPAEVASPALSSDAMTPPPPLVSATVPPALEKRAEEPPPAAPAPSEDVGLVIYGLAVTGGLHHWTSSQTSTSTSEADFGLNATGEFGFRVAHSLGISLLADGGYTAMADGLTGLVGGLGAGLRLDHMSGIPGRFTIGGLASFAAISKSTTPPAPDFATINASGLQLFLQWALPIVGPLALDLRTSVHLFSDNLTLFSLTVGAAIGN